MEEELVVDGVGLGVSDDQPYNKINILNESLDALANEVNGIDMNAVNNEVAMPVVSSDEVSNEVAMPTVSIAEVNNDLSNPEETITKEEEKEQAELVKEITSEEEDATNEPSSRGQFILIGILSFILIVLLIAMVVFTNAL